MTAIVWNQHDQRMEQNKLVAHRLFTKLRVWQPQMNSRLQISNAWDWTGTNVRPCSYIEVAGWTMNYISDRSSDCIQKAGSSPHVKHNGTKAAYSSSKTVKSTRKESPFYVVWTPIFIIITHSLNPEGDYWFPTEKNLIMILMHSFELLMGCLVSKRQGHANSTHLQREEVLCLISPENKERRGYVRMGHKIGLQQVWGGHWESNKDPWSWSAWGRLARSTVSVTSQIDGSWPTQPFSSRR